MATVNKGTFSCSLECPLYTGLTVWLEVVMFTCGYYHGCVIKFTLYIYILVKSKNQS